MSTPELLIETDSVRLFGQAGAADAGEAWVTFQGLRLDTVVGAGFLRRRGVPAFHFVARRHEWYLGEDIAELVQDVGARLAAMRARVIALGPSMGGFAAILHARALGAETIIAIGPQVVVDRRESRGHDENYDREWQELERRGMSRDASRLVDPAARLLVAYDPFNTADAWHVARLKRLPNARFWHLPFAGHELAAEIYRLGLWPAALAAAADLSDAGWRDVAREYRRARRERFHYHYELAGWFDRKRRYADAIACYRAAIAIRPDFPPAYAALAVSCERLGRTDEAIAALAAGVGRLDGDERYWWMFQRLANLHRQADALDAAEAVLAAGVRMFPAKAETHGELGRFRLFTRNSARGQAGAVRALRRAIARDPVEPDYRRRLGEAQGARVARIVARWPRVAERVLGGSADGLLDGADLHLGLSMALERQHDRAGAVRAAERAVALIGADGDRRWWIHGHLAGIRLRGGDPELAAAARARADVALREAVRRAPDDAEIHADYARFLDAHAPARAGMASRLLRRAIALRRDVPEYREDLALAEIGRAALFVERRPDLARRAVDAAVPWLRVTVDAQHRLSLVRERLGDRAGAIAAIERGIGRIGDDGRYWWMYQRLAELHLADRDPARAEAVLRQGLARLPDEPAMQAELARFLLRNRRSRETRTEARRLIHGALARVPDDPGFAEFLAMLTMTRAYCVAWRFPKIARTLLEDGVRRFPHNIEVHDGLAAALQQLGEPAAAAEVLERGLGLIGDDARYWWMYQRLAYLHLAERDVDRAEQVLMAAVARFPKTAATHAELGRFRLRHRRDRAGRASAKRLVARAIALEPDEPGHRDLRATLTMARAQDLAGRFPAIARAILEDAVRRFSDSIDAHDGLSLALERLGDRQGAIDVLERGVALIGEDDRYWWLYQRLAYLHLGLGDLDRAEDALVRAAQRFPRTPAALAELGKFRLQNRKTRAGRTAAARLLRDAAHLARDNMLYRHFQVEATMARAAALVDRFPRIARPLLEEAARLLPESIDAQYGLATALDRLDETDAAKAALERAIALIGRDERYWWLYQYLAGVSYRRGDAATGIAVLRRGLAHFPQLAAMQAELAKILLLFGQRGTWAEAARLQRRAVALAPDNAEYRALAIDIAVRRAGRFAQRRPAASLRAFGRMIAAEPARIDLHHGITYPLAALGRLDEAGAAIARAIALIPPAPPADPEGWWWIDARAAELHLLGGDLDRAEAAYRRGVERQPLSCWAAFGWRRFRVRYRGVAPVGEDALEVRARHELGLQLLIDPAWYRARAGALFGEEPRFHYLERGAAAATDPHPLFDTAHYLAQRPVLDGLTPLGHFIVTALAQRLDPHPLFDTDWYLAQAGADPGLDPLSHYLLFGAAAGLDPHPLFDTDWYLAQHADVRATGENPLVHYVRAGAAEGRAPHPSFDARWFRARHAGVAAAQAAPLEYYLAHAREPGVDPHPGFDSARYAARHLADDPAANPLAHHLATGTPAERPTPIRNLLFGRRAPKTRA